MIKPKTILLTGIHHTPAVELIGQLNKFSQHKWTIYYVTDLADRQTHSKYTLPALGIKIHHLESPKFNRHHPLGLFLSFPKFINSIVLAYSYIKKIKPDIVLSFGGYVSTPVIIASYLLRIPALTHEQTHHPGLANRINSLFCQHLLLSFPTKKKRSNYVVTGNLIRHSIYLSTNSFLNKYNPQLTKTPLIYITGGSQGSHAINQNVLQILPDLKKKYLVIHQTGDIDYQKISKTQNRPNYLPLNYVDQNNIGWIFRHASLIISRAGANICQEIVALNHKSILIPLPNSQHREQDYNASWVKKHIPSTITIQQSKLNPRLLKQTIIKSFKHPPLTINYQYRPNLKILKIIDSIVST